MADAKKCDRCNRYYDNSEHMKKEFSADPEDKYSNKQSLHIVTPGYDICEPCTKIVLCAKYKLRKEQQYDNI